MKRIFVFLGLFVLIFSSVSFASSTNTINLNIPYYNLGKSNQYRNSFVNNHKFSATNMDNIAVNGLAANRGFGREGSFGTTGFGVSSQFAMRYDKTQIIEGQVGTYRSGTFNKIGIGNSNYDRGYGRTGVLGTSGFGNNGVYGNYMHRYNRRFNNLQARDSIKPSYWY